MGRVRMTDFNAASPKLLMRGASLTRRWPWQKKEIPGFGGAGSRKFDLRTTDMWLFLLQNDQYRRAWNLLSPGVGTNQRLRAETGTPSIVMPRDNGKFEIHVRLKNFGNQPVSARIEGQTVEHLRAAGHQGELIVTDYQNISPGGEAVYKQHFPTWDQSNDQRTWARVGDERQELIDFRGSSRHLTYIDVRSGNI